MKPGKDYIGVACFGLVINNNDEILLINKKNKDVWERPGGKLEFGETFEDCLVREIKEETGVDIIVDKHLITEQFKDSDDGCGWVCIGHLCRYKSGKAKLKEPEKHNDVKWFSLNNLPKLTKYSENAIRAYLESKK